MLLPSDVARLVLGYLQEEGLSATSQAFIQESPNLKEYAEHTMGDAALPACVFSVFGKGLTTILNEYMAAKTKETCHEVPAMMTSLWKKLDFTLKQIKSLQCSSAVSASQRARTRVGLGNLARQRGLAVTSAKSLICSSETSLISSPALSSQSMVSHSTPMSYSSPQIRAPPGNATPQQFHDISRSLNIQRDSPIQIIVSEQRPNPGPMSPGRRKWDTPRKRSGGPGGSSGAGKSSTLASNVAAEPQPEEVVNENFPQLVIQSARDKILGDRSLQEKLAENINKILANEPTPQIPKPPSSSIEDDQSIDEILGLQGEIHMSDDAIHDILEQTESDPAFQALFELFDYNKSRTDEEPGNMDSDNMTGESDNAGPLTSTVGQLQSNDPDTTVQETSDLTAATVKSKAIQEHKTRKSNALLKKNVLGSSGKSSQIENSAKLLITLEEPPGDNVKEKASVFNDSIDTSLKDIDNTLDMSGILKSKPTLRELEFVSKDSLPATMSLVDSAATLLSRGTARAEPIVNADDRRERKQEQGSLLQPAAALSSSQSDESIFLSSAQVTLSRNPSLTSVAISDGTIPHQMNPSVTPQSTSSTYSTAGYTVTHTSATNAVTACSPLSCSVNAPHTSQLDSFTFTSTTSSISGVIGTAQASSLTSINNTPCKDVTDSNNVVSLKIIISDEDSSSDKALSQAISSISTEKLPTIYLSSPAKSPRQPGTPRGTNLDETALAVHGLQRSEALAKSPCRAGALVPFHQLTSSTQKQAKFPLVPPHLLATAQTQQSYIIQLPLDTANPAVQGASTSYFFMTEHLTADTSLPAGFSKVPLLPQNSPYSVSTASPAQTNVTGSPLILPSSPVKSMMLPGSVVGQNARGNIQMVTNQLVGITNPVSLQQTVTVDPKLSMVAANQSGTGGIIDNEVTQNLQNAIQQHEPKDSTSSHKRVLCFESSAKIQPPTSKPATNPSSAVNTSTSQCVSHTKKGRSKTTRPAILSGNKQKRKVETVKCSAEPKGDGILVKSISHHQQQNPVQLNSDKQDDTIFIEEPQPTLGSRIDVSHPEFVKTSEPGTKLKSAAAGNCYNDDARLNDSGSLESPSNSVLKSMSCKDKVESSRKEPVEDQAEKRTHTQDKPNLMADKENKLMGHSQEQQPSLTAFSAAPADLPSPSNSQPKAAKIPSKTSSLAIQAAEMLQNIQGLNSPLRPGKRLQVGLNSPDLTVPRTSGTIGNQEDSMNSPRTPLQQKKGKDTEGTPKNLLQPKTSDVPSCSPASEAGSENSINMAAHTLMILSRAAIARTSSPLKDSLRQEVGEKSPTGLKNSKKRKQPSSTASSPATKSSKQSPIKKRKQQRKTLINCFPHDLDVDKFLSSLHYDE